MGMIDEYFKYRNQLPQQELNPAERVFNSSVLSNNWSPEVGPPAPIDNQFLTPELLQYLKQVVAAQGTRNGSIGYPQWLPNSAPQNQGAATAAIGHMMDRNDPALQAAMILGTAGYRTNPKTRETEIYDMYDFPSILPGVGMLPPLGWAHAKGEEILPEEGPNPRGRPVRFSLGKIFDE